MKRVLIALTACTIIGSCVSKKADKDFPAPVATCDTTNVTYSGVVKKILVDNCATAAGCHTTADNNGGVALDTYEKVAAAFSSSRVGYAKIMDDINQATGTTYNAMPKNAAKLSDCNISKIAAWNHKGFPND